MQRVDCVLFDLDGTLVESAPEIADAVNDLLTAQGLAAVSEELVAAWIGHGTSELMAQAWAHATGVTRVQLRSDDVLQRLMPRFAEFYARRCGSRSRLYPTVRETLQELRARGVRCAVVTNKEQRYTAQLLLAHQIRHYFDVVVSGDSLAAKKPDPLPVRYCLDALQVAPSHALFVGDSEIDVATARAAGLRVWTVPYGYNMGRPIAEAGPDRVIPTLDALLAVDDQQCAA